MTNDKECLDAALKNRPGRFDRHWKFDYCNEDTIRKVLELNVKNIDCSQEIKEHIVKLLFGLGKITPAHVKEFTTLLIMEGLKENKDADAKVVVTKEIVDRCLGRVLSEDKKIDIGFKKKD
jgi:ATP-dependent 26S proteasome regulatory subunit